MPNSFNRTVEESAKVWLIVESLLNASRMGSISVKQDKIAANHFQGIVRGRFAFISERI